MTKPARLALVVPAFPQLSETFIVTKATGLIARGWDVQVVCSSSDEAQWDAFGPDHPVQQMRGRVHVAPELARNRSALRAVGRSVTLLRRAPRGAVRRYLTSSEGSLYRRVHDLITDAAVLALDPDLVHFEFGSLAVGRMALRERVGCPITVSFRGYDLGYVGLEDPGHYDEVWRSADRVHLLGDDLWERARHRGAPSDLRHSLISPAIDAATIEPIPSRAGQLGRAGDPFRVLSVGRLHWKKGYEYALEAIAALRAKGCDVRYRIIGDGDLLEAVSFWRHQLDLDHAVELLGALPPAEVKEQLGWADVFLHAATSEGFCNAVIEAQAHGVPVVTSDADGLAENVAADVTGLVVPRRDAAALSGALECLSSEPVLRTSMAAAGPERVRRLFLLDRQLDAWERFYEVTLAEYLPADL
jgi:colanic acid/amylovoran biosynthesis glycosyltransferase